MKKRVACVLAASGLLFFSLADADARWGPRWSRPGVALPVLRTLLALHRGGVPIDVRDRYINPELKWVEIDVFDEDYPLTLNIVAKRRTRVTRIAYLITSSSLNFRSSFFTPPEASLASYFTDRDYLVVGITPREDNVPLDADLSVMADWGMDKHRVDIRGIVDPIQDALRLPYDMVGHSLGAIVALDYAAVYSGHDFKSVMVLDVPSFGPDDVVQVYPGVDPVSAYQLAGASLFAYDQMLAEEKYGDAAIAELKDLAALTVVAPDFDTGVPRPLPIPEPGTFTAGGLLHYSLIFTAFLPGAITPYTANPPFPGLPQEWPMVLGNTAGFYEFDLADPLGDQFGLALTTVERIQDVAFAVGSGLTPIALARDYTAAISNDAAYPATYRIDWADVNEAVRWVNGGLGMGEATYGATVMQAAGNSDVVVEVVPMYGHIDVILSDTAAEDVWSLLLP